MHDIESHQTLEKSPDKFERAKGSSTERKGRIVLSSTEMVDGRTKSDKHDIVEQFTLETENANLAIQQTEHSALRTEVKLKQKQTHFTFQIYFKGFLFLCVIGGNVE